MAPRARWVPCPLDDVAPWIIIQPHQAAGLPVCVALSPNSTRGGGWLAMRAFVEVEPV
jgi:hypothetical protein